VKKQEEVLKPLANRVVVKLLDSAEKTAGGIYVPPTSEEEIQKGVVVAVGPGVTLDNGKIAPMQVKKGDVVIFGKYTGAKITGAEEKLFIFREPDILAVIE
jgi:chaperonin GroES